MIVIPARLHSTRLPRKMLLDKTGKALIQHTYEAAARAEIPDRVVVATDHQDIADVVHAFGGEAILTDPEAASGTDRVAEVAQNFQDYSLFVNLQGDEPELEPAAIDRAVNDLAGDGEAVMSTLATPIREKSQLFDPSCVKIVFDNKGNALYFSRSPIPHIRDGDAVLEESLTENPPPFFLHVGLYCYRRDFLLELGEMPESVYEKSERLEQLRVLQNGYRIKTTLIEQSAPGIDTPEDYEAFVKRCQC